MKPDAAVAAPGSATVSVVMTTYNGASFVAAAIASILTQSHRSLELVVIDDDSSDDTRDIVRDLAANDPRLRFVVAAHRGIAASRNAGLALVEGRFVAFLDQDDLCPPGKIARQYACLSATADSAAVFGTTIMFDRTADTAGTPAIDDARSNLTMLIAAALFRRDVFDDIGGFDPSYEIADDFDFLLRLIEAGKRIDVETETGVLYRRHDGQRTADRAGTRYELMLALRRSLQRRRAKGIVEPLRHPLVNSGLLP